MEQQNNTCNETCNCQNEETACNCQSEKTTCNCQSEETTCNCQPNNTEKNLKKEKKEKKDKHKEEIKKLKEQNKQLEETTLREKAELINYRKRKDEEISRMLKYANEDLVKQILPVLDNFERAIEMDNKDLTDEVSKFLSGFKMIYCHLKEDLEKFGVIAIDGNNKPFDPVYHQAVLTDKIENIESGIVIEVMQKGYLLKDKVIRPAMVKVSE